MNCIFEASSGLEAHMISNLLQQEGIDARIDGEYLQGGVGELQAMGFVRILVNDTDHEKAHKIIKTWNANQPVSAKPQITNNNSRLGLGILIGLIIGTGITFLLYNTPTNIDGIDYNDDGNLDEKWVYKDNRLTRGEVDRNLDGNVDTIYKYNIKGRLYKSESDENFDGVFESIVTYKRGVAVSQISDTDQDGIIDNKAYFTNGVLTEIEILGPTPSSPKLKQKYNMHKLISSEFDSNGDGIYDKQFTYDYYEHIKE